jgi:hypothetical protein
VPWKILAIVLLVVLFIAYRIFKWFYAARPTFIPRPDAAPRTKISGAGSEPSMINFAMVLNANAAEDRYEFHTDESNLVTYLRREE